jgi:hypothetical protein
MTLNRYPQENIFEKTMGFMRSGKLTFMGVGCYALCKAHWVFTPDKLSRYASEKKPLDFYMAK